MAPLAYGLEEDEKKIIKHRLNNFINSVFKNNDVKKLVIVTHPHRDHLLKDKKKYKGNISLVINDTIFNSSHKNKILHINFNDDFNHVYKNMELEDIFLKGDRSSHLTIQNYLDYYYPHIFSKCCN